MVKEHLGLKFVTSNVAVVIITVGSSLFNEEVALRGLHHNENHAVEGTLF